LIKTIPGTGRVVRQTGEEPDEPSGPHYRRISDDLRSKIESGELAPGDALPSEAGVVEQYGVSRGTARQALADLEGAGLVEPIPGKGRFVRRRP
jgi:DNA-binding GntR family transcriptional regulator